ncbi:carboxymuconolactone decarboxylase family protein [Nonomuraea dietziae]|uniref:carboxymuconolactone decarboxylase family protein n=1 Tax=Nonomuraea dietziae TaxID=65515 RepID=UPI00341A1522
MPRLPQLTEDPDGLLEETRRQLGRVPNLYATLANSSAALSGYLSMRGRLSKGVLSARLREQIALLVAQENGCTYCVSAHTLRGSRMGLTDEELLSTRTAHDADPHAGAVLALTQAIVRTAGRIDSAELTAARAAGVTDAEIAEIVAHVGLNTLSNYFNHVAEPELDFPEVSA